MSFRTEPFHVVADRLQARGQWDRQHQAGRIPQEAPKHQGEGYHERIQVHPRADNLRIKHVQRDQVEQRYSHDDKNVNRDRV